MTDESVQTAESSPADNQTIDATSLFNAALAADEAGQWGNDGALDLDAQQIAANAKEVTSGNRPTDASGEEAAVKDKAEPSAEQKQQPEQVDTGPPRDEKGRFLPKQKEQEPAADQPSESKYAKARKEEERQKSVLSNFEKEKQEFRAWQEAERKRIEAEKAEIEKFKAIPRAPDGTPHEFNSRQYGKFADDAYARGKQALKEGDIEVANKYFDQAEQASIAAEQVAKAEQYAQQRQGLEKHQQVWAQNMDSVLAQDPSLRDPENPVSKEIKAILEDQQWGPIIDALPNGFGFAAQVMKWKVAAADASALSEEIKQLKAENADLRQRTGIRPTPVAGGIPPARTPDQMEDSEFRSWLKTQAAELDRVPVPGW